MNKVSLKNGIVFDYKNLDYIFSAGLRVLLVIRKKFKDSFIVINVREEVKQLLEINVFIDILTID